MRNYNSFSEDRKTITSEIMILGESTDWFFGTESEGKLAAEIEKDLSKYNIGYTNAGKGKWSYRLGGTRYFKTLKWLGFVKSKANSLMENFKSSP